jgi:hypothetical protein
MLAYARRRYAYWTNYWGHGLCGLAESLRELILNGSLSLSPTRGMVVGHNLEGESRADDPQPARVTRLQFMSVVHGFLALNDRSDGPGRAVTANSLKPLRRLYPR